MIRFTFKTLFLALLLFAISAYSLKVFKQAGATPKFAIVLFYVVVVFGLTAYKSYSEAVKRA